MRIGLVVYGSLDTISGGYLYDRKLVAHLRRHGDEVEVISLPFGNYLRHLGDNASSALYRRLAGSGLDVLLQDELNHPSLFLMNRRLRGKVNYPIVSIVHHLRSCEGWPAWQNSLYRLVERNYLSGVDAFVYISRATRRAVELLLGEKRPCIVAYPAGDRLEPRISREYVARRSQSGGLRILFVGNLIPRKGLHTLIEALEKLPVEQWELTVVGDGEVDPVYRQKIAGLVKVRGMAGKVRFTGAISDRELAGEMKKSHLLAMPSTHEGYGIVYLEGMGFGLPAIGTSAGGAGEVITHGRDGFLVPPGDVASLAGYLAALAGNRERLAEMSVAALGSYRAHPAWEATMEAVRAFLTDVRGR